MCLYFSSYDTRGRAGKSLLMYTLLGKKNGLVPLKLRFNKRASVQSRGIHVNSGVFLASAEYIRENALIPKRERARTIDVTGKRVT